MKNLPPKIHPEFVGAARAWFRSVETLPSYGEKLHTIMRTLQERHNKHPNRRVPARMIADVTFQWWKAGDSPGRVFWKNELSRRSGSIREIRLVHGRLNRPGWEEKENVVQLMCAKMSFSRRRDLFSCSCSHYIGLHAVARFVQRTGIRDHKRITEEVMKIVTVRPDDHRENTRVDAEHWRGIVTRDFAPDRWANMGQFTPKREEGDPEGLCYIVRTWFERDEDEE